MILHQSKICKLFNQGVVLANVRIINITLLANLLCTTAQHADDANTHWRHTQCWWPILIQYGQADVTITVDMRMYWYAGPYKCYLYNSTLSNLSISDMASLLTCGESNGYFCEKTNCNLKCSPAYKVPVTNYYTKFCAFIRTRDTSSSTSYSNIPSAPSTLTTHLHLILNII